MSDIILFVEVVSRSPTGNTTSVTPQQPDDDIIRRRWHCECDVW